LDSAIDCVYSSNKRERDKELLEKLIAKNKQLESSLQRLIEVQETSLV
jgi:hypothetical protein